MPSHSVAPPPIRPTPYSGELILEEDDFLRRLPLLLNARQRITVDALVHIADCLAASYRSLHRTALLAARDEDMFPILARAELSNAAWSIVDDLYSAKNLIRILVKERGPASTQLLEALEPAALTRNKMDHLDRQIGPEVPGGLLTAKGLRRAVFGSVSFFHIDRADVANHDVEVRWISVSAGPLREKSKFPFVFPVGEPLATPIDRFQLSAFDQDVDLSNCVALYRDWIRVFSQELKETCLEQIRAQTTDEAEIARVISTCEPNNVMHFMRFTYAGPAERQADEL